MEDIDPTANVYPAKNKIFQLKNSDFVVKNTYIQNRQFDLEGPHEELHCWLFQLLRYRQKAALSVNFIAKSLVANPILIAIEKHATIPSRLVTRYKNKKVITSNLNIQNILAYLAKPILLALPILPDTNAYLLHIVPAAP